MPLSFEIDSISPGSFTLQVPFRDWKFRHPIRPSDLCPDSLPPPSGCRLRRFSAQATPTGLTEESETTDEQRRFQTDS